jgi:hypothetical protein
MVIGEEEEEEEVIGHWSLVIGHWSLVIGQESLGKRKCLFFVFTNDQ